MATIDNEENIQNLPQIVSHYGKASWNETASDHVYL